MTTRSPKYEVKEMVLSMMDKGMTDLEVLSELCHKHGKKYATAKMHIRKYRKVHTEWNRPVIVKSLMTGNDVKIKASTPFCCDPSTETFWSM